MTSFIFSSHPRAPSSSSQGHSNPRTHSLTSPPLPPPQTHTHTHTLSQTHTHSFTHSLTHLLHLLLSLLPSLPLYQVCNHPDLFEPRPITSPFVDSGIRYSPGRLVTTAVRAMPFYVDDYYTSHCDV